MAKPKFRELRRSYGFDEVAIVPGDITVNPEQADISLEIEGIKLDIPVLASAMDGVTDVKTAITLSKLGGLGVIHLEGVQTRYDNPDDVLAEIARAPVEKVTPSKRSPPCSRRYTPPRLRKTSSAKGFRRLKKRVRSAPPRSPRPTPSALPPSSPKLEPTYWWWPPR